MYETPLGSYTRVPFGRPVPHTLLPHPSVVVPEWKLLPLYNIVPPLCVLVPLGQTPRIRWNDVYPRTNDEVYVMPEHAVGTYVPAPTVP